MANIRRFSVHLNIDDPIDKIVNDQLAKHKKQSSYIKLLILKDAGINKNEDENKEEVKEIYEEEAIDLNGLGM